jgi:hypothetical protein
VRFITYFPVVSAEFPLGSEDCDDISCESTRGKDVDVLGRMQSAATDDRGSTPESWDLTVNYLEGKGKIIDSRKQFERWNVKRAEIDLLIFPQALNKAMTTTLCLRLSNTSKC